MFTLLASSKSNRSFLGRGQSDNREYSPKVILTRSLASGTMKTQRLLEETGGVKQLRRKCLFLN